MWWICCGAAGWWRRHAARVALNPRRRRCDSVVTRSRRVVRGVGVRSSSSWLMVVYNQRSLGMDGLTFRSCQQGTSSCIFNTVVPVSTVRGEMTHHRILKRKWTSLRKVSYWSVPPLEPKRSKVRFSPAVTAKQKPVQRTGIHSLWHITTY